MNILYLLFMDLSQYTIYNKGIQPVWIEIENQTRHRMWFLPVSVDPDYFAPSEVAYKNHFGYTRASKTRIDRHFQENEFQNPIDPGAIRSGFVFTHLELGTKAFNVEVVVSDHRVRTFTFLVPVEGLPVDHRQVDWTALFESQSADQIDSMQALQESLEKQPDRRSLFHRWPSRCVVGLQPAGGLQKGELSRMGKS